MCEWDSRRQFELGRLHWLESGVSGILSLSLNGLEPKFELSASWFCGIGHTTGIFSFSVFAGPCGLDDCKQ